MLRASTKFSFKHAARLTGPASALPYASKVTLVAARSQASSSDPCEYEQIMRMGVFASPASPNPAMSRAYGASRTQSGVVQQAVSGAYRSVKEPTMFEDYDRFDLPTLSEKTQFSYYNASYDPTANGGETGSVV
ncbi:hypothetical protein HJC23_002360 [Cyclotella cryptica]|uniref:Uncharacterized protein n=1 Tax=Cyclotella cryptica TaxID=29204 RepID=A0ABD3QLN4_9STRA|eukprot:CCRYP_004454-RA/>CCRYP_004454-RA protein AED:0.32 eAED:0.32 QI:0/-1/0/1/-1/1/1/0/133